MSIKTDVEMYTFTSDADQVTAFALYHVKQISLLAVNVERWRDKMSEDTGLTDISTKYDTTNKIILGVWQTNDVDSAVTECRRLSASEVKRVNRATNSIYAPSKFDPVFQIVDNGLTVSPDITGATKTILEIPFDIGITSADTESSIENYPEELYQLLIVSIAISVLQERMNDYLYEQEDAELVQLEKLQLDTLLQEQQKLMIIAGFSKGDKNAS